MLKLFNEQVSLDKDEEQEIMDIIDNLSTIPGINDKTIFALISECGDLSRFKNNSHLIGYLGLYPTLEQSGNKLTYGPIANVVPNWLRKLFIKLLLLPYGTIKSSINSLEIKSLKVDPKKKQLSLLQGSLPTSF